MNPENVKNWFRSAGVVDPPDGLRVVVCGWDFQDGAAIRRGTVLYEPIDSEKPGVRWVIDSCNFQFAKATSS